MDTIPQSHIELLLHPNVATLTTIMPNGIPQSSLVWIDWDGTNILINTTKERQKGKNMLQNSKIALIVVDPKDSGRWVSIQGQVEIESKGAIEQLDRVTQKYTKYDTFYGNIYPVEQQFRETRIICKIKPLKVFIDAIHK